MVRLIGYLEQNINLDKDAIPNYFMVADTNLFIYYFQWINNKIPIEDISKCEIIKDIFNICLDKHIIININSKIFSEIENITKNKLKLYLDLKILKEITGLENFKNLDILPDKDLEIIYDWYSIEHTKYNNDFNIADMKIYFLEQKRLIDSSYDIHTIYTEDISDFYNCKNIYKKHYLNYNLSYKDILIKHFSSLEEYLIAKFKGGDKNAR